MYTHQPGDVTEPVHLVCIASLHGESMFSSSCPLKTLHLLMLIMGDLPRKAKQIIEHEQCRHTRNDWLNAALIYQAFLIGSKARFCIMSPVPYVEMPVSQVRQICRCGLL